MILGLEIVFLVVGLYALFTAKLPTWFIGKGYRAEGNNIRIAGGLMVAILPAVLCGSFTIGVIGGIADFDPTTIVRVGEFLVVLGAAIAVNAWIKKIREPITPQDTMINQNVEPK